MKPRIVWILAAFAVVAAVASASLLLSPSFVRSQELAVKPFDKVLGKGDAILARTRAGRFGVLKGDAFPYLVEIWYDPEQVSEIDRTSLDSNVNLEPFEIRDVKEKTIVLESGTRVYQRAYEIQLIEGEVEHLYEFPSIVVRYSLESSEALLSKAVTPEPVYVASRLPADITDMDLGSGPGYGPLRPVRGAVEDASRSRLPWILWAVGGVLAILAVGDFTWRVLPQWKKGAGHSTKVDVIGVAYQSLLHNVEGTAEPRLLFYQMERILRIVLARKENVDWLEEPELDATSSGIRGSVTSLFEACQKAYKPQSAERDDVAQALGQLEEILCFYFGKAEIAAWKN